MTNDLTFLEIYETFEPFMAVTVDLDGIRQGQMFPKYFKLPQI
jgi:hypothetical protein